MQQNIGYNAEAINKELNRINDTASIGEIFVTYGYLIPNEDLAKVTTSGDAVTYFKNNCFNPLTVSYREEAYAIFLNRANKVIGWNRLSMGGVTGTVVDPRLVMSLALNCGACGVILAHNHPSGNTNPSRADEEITQKIKKACELFDIKLLDHVIITAENHFSFADQGIM